MTSNSYINGHHAHSTKSPDESGQTGKAAGPEQAADMNNASLALNDWNAQGAERLLKTASHDITAGTTGISQATADSNNYQS